VAVVAVAVLVVGALVVTEVILQVASRVSRDVARLLAAPWEIASPLVPDERLIQRGSPLRFDHDAAGYRNDRRPARADVVTLGDSMTYGPVDPREVWPRILSGATGRATYNMALPSYGPVQSLLQLDDALSLRPQVVIVAPYFGNDLFDSFLMIRRHPTLQVALPSDLMRQASDLDRRQPLEQDVASPFTVGVDGTEQQVTGLRRWVSTHVQLFKLARALKPRATGVPRPDPLLSRNFASAAAALTAERRESLSPVEARGWRTILSGRYRLRAVDDRDPRIRAGFLAMCTALEEMAARTRAAGARFIVVLFPTKESVFWPRISDPDRHPGLREIVANEDRLRAELTGRLRTHGVEVLDLLEIFRGAAEQPYHEDVDGHPNGAGYRLVAAVVAARLAVR